MMIIKKKKKRYKLHQCHLGNFPILCAVSIPILFWYVPYGTSVCTLLHSLIVHHVGTL